MEVSSLVLDMVLRLPAITVMVLWIGILLAARLESLIKALFIALLAASIASSLHTLPDLLRTPFPIHQTALILAIPAAALQWSLARVLLEDEFRPGVAFAAVFAAACTLKASWSLAELGVSLPLHDFRYHLTYLVSGGMLLHVLWIAAAGLKTDTVRSRRRLRYIVVGLISVIGVAALLFETAGVSGRAEALFIQASQLVALSIVLFTLVGFSIDAGAAAPDIRRTKADSDRLSEDLDRLSARMDADRLYLRDDLDVAKLASILALPEHRLRRVIHEALGQKNFSYYLNGLRISHAKSLLMKSDSRKTSILEIAMDSGFGSLSTFNRVFKSREGVTPREFRQLSAANG